MKEPAPGPAPGREGGETECCSLPSRIGEGVVVGGRRPEGVSMKITNVEPIIVSAGPGKKNFTFVVVDTDEGIWGVGESGLSSRELAVAGAVEHLKSFLVGKNPMQIERLWQEMFRGGFFPAGNITAAAIAAIDIALWDIKGKALNVPIYELLGGLTRDKLVCYPHVQRCV